jgi:hypothetical protein
MQKDKLFLLVTTVVYSLLQPQTAHAQQAFNFYGGVGSTSTTTANRGTIYQINGSTGSEAVAVDLVTTFPSLFGSAALSFTGTNGYSYDVATDKIYFSVTSGTSTDGRGNNVNGDKGVYWWQRGTNTSGQLLSFSSLTTPDQNTAGTNITRQLGADTAFVYDGYYYFMQDQAVDVSGPKMYRINLSGTPALQTLNDFNGTSATGSTRTYYDYGDIAVSSGGILSGSSRDGRGGAASTTQWFFTGDVSSGGGGVGGAGTIPTFAGYTESGGGLRNAANPDFQLAYGWANTTTNNSSLYGYSGFDNKFYNVNASTGALGTVLYSGVTYRGYSDLTSAVIPEPTTLALLSVGFGGFLLRRRKKYKNYKK